MDQADIRYRPGDWIEDRYEVEASHRGGMGYVLLGHDHEKDCPIAIKTFEHRFLDSEQNHKKFLEEASTWIQLERHPNIVQAYYLKYIGESPYLFLERVPSNPYRGATLKDFIFSRHLSEKLMIQIAIQICDGMIHALEKIPNLVHRDLKCENILIGENDVPKVSDFGMTLNEEVNDQGLVMDHHDEDNDTTIFDLARRMEGTPAFASPEQCLGYPLDTRSDIYSFGCLLYQMVTRQPPFAFSTVEETIRAQLNERPVDPLSLNDAIHSGFSLFILRCMEKEPEDRYDTFYDARETISRLYYEWFHEELPSCAHSTMLSPGEYTERGRSFFLLGMFDRARLEFEKALFLSPAEVEATLGLSEVYMNEDDPMKALSCIEKLDLKSIDNPQVYKMKGDILDSRGQWPEAVLAYERAVSVERGNCAHYLALGRCHMLNRNFDKAELAFKDGLNSCNEKEDLFRGLAMMYKMLGRRESERSVLKQVVGICPGDIQSVLRIAEICVELNDTVRLKMWVRKAVALNPDQPEVLYRLGSILLSLNDRKRAADAWKRASQGGYESADFMKEYAELEHDLHQYESAWNAVLRAEELGAEVESLKKGIQAKRLHTMLRRP